MKMPISDCDVRDPRVRRTRQLLQKALHKLLEEKSFDEILVGDITDAATVNRATFYDHYSDKFALFDSMVASNFHRLLEERDIRLAGNCSSALADIILAVCDFLKQSDNHNDCARQNSFVPLMDAAVTRSIQRVVLDGLSKHGAEYAIPREYVASSVSWAIYGAVKEWFSSAKRRPAEEFARALVKVVLPLIAGNNNPGQIDVTRKKHRKSKKSVGTAG
jgi:AcrR family transcriptional regulator